MKKRIFGLDFIRAIAVISILLTHFNAKYIYMFDEAVLHKIVLCRTVSNIYIGDFGVSLFLIVSGAALMKTYENKLILTEFYKKRFLGIYPMFWIAYFFAFMYTFWYSKGIDQTIPKWSIIWSVLGMDGFLNGIVPTFYKLGEWFLGFIIIFYIIFPILKWGIDKYPLIVGLVILGGYVAVNIQYDLPLYRSMFLFTRLPELAFGMYYIKYIRKIKGYIAVAALALLIGNMILQPSVNKDIQTTYVGISAFLFLIYIGEYVEKYTLVVDVCKMLSKYSYAIFLTHHFIISLIVAKFDLYNITVLESYLLFGLCCCVIGCVSRILYDTNSYVLKRINKICISDY